MEKKTIIKIAQALSLLLFIGLAMASGSSSSVQKHMDDFVDGYNYGRSLREDAEDSDNAIESEVSENPENQDHISLSDSK